MEDIKKIAGSILDKGFVMSLATVDSNGPWVSDVIYITKDFDLYWKSEVKRRHSTAILSNPKVAVSITLTKGPTEPDIGLQIEGSAGKIEGGLPEMEEKLRVKMAKPSFVAGEEKLNEGHSWYRLKPTKIDVIYQPLFGFQKKQVPI